MWSAIVQTAIVSAEAAINLRLQVKIIFELSFLTLNEPSMEKSFHQF